MRPVERGDTPTDGDGRPIEFGEYADARDPLIDRIGDYCSYCEVALHSSVHVEHVRPKSRHQELEKQWTNLLLACDYCNPTKGDTDVVLDEYFWPDRDNTARAFRYDCDQPPCVAHGLTAEQIAKAARTLELTGLDRVPGHPRISDRDRRWLKRQEVWGVALNELKNLRENDTPQLRMSIVHVALSRGFWSVWMQVFSDDADMRRRLINSFAGTAKNCFDHNTVALPRPGGRV